MTLALLLDASLLLLILAVAVWTVAVRDSFAAVVGYTVYGLLLALAWVRLAAVDAALTEAAIGGGLTGVLLIRAAVRLRASESAARAETPGPLVKGLAAILAGAIAAALALVVLTLPDPAPTLAPQVAEHIASTGLGNAVTAVLLAFRAIDTLLEAVVLIFALIAVWTLTPDNFWGGRPGPKYDTDPNGMLAYLARLLPPIGIVVAVYVLWVGADLPGGKFQAGTLLAAMWLLAIMAGLTEAPPIRRRWLRGVLVAGTVVFLAIGFAGVPLAGAFLAYPEGFAKPLIIAIEAASMLSIAFTLALLVLGPPERSEHS
ncbi:MAG: hydrogen gas-evolving membrane-bound hydrogenase subunit E [Azonexus sp.]